MRETEFISQNKEKWQEFEKSLKQKSRDAEKLSELFVETTDDLSYSRTYYPNRSVRVYLNGIAQTVYQSLYKTDKDKRGSFTKFWKETLPEVMWRSRTQLLISVLVFVGATCIGLWSASENPDFVRIILGDQYVEMTEANIEAGDPMAVYKDDNAVMMFLQIAQNNIQVSFICFVLGIMAGVGTAFALTYNGIMFGAFMGFFIERGLMKESVLAVMQHGTLELSMITLAGCAGFALASGIVLPGNYSRLQSLVISARRGIVIMIGVSALLVVAAIIESFGTRYTEMPDWLRILVILLSLTLVIGYFVYYPWRRHKMGLIPEENEDELQPERTQQIKLDEIKSNGKIFTEVFRYLRSSFSKFSRTAILSAVGGTVMMYFAVPGDLGDFVVDETAPDYLLWFIDVLWPWNEINNFFDINYAPWMFFVYVAILTPVLAHAAIAFIYRHQSKITSQHRSVILVNALTVAPIMIAMLVAPTVLTLLLVVLVLPLALFFFVHACLQEKFWLACIGSGFKTIKLFWGRLLGLFLVLLAGPWILFLFISGPLWVWIFYALKLNVPHTWAIASELPWLVYSVFSFFLCAIAVSLFVYGTFLFHHSLNEIKYAHNLRSLISQVGSKKRAYGLEKE